jgi:hypothetical protein
MIGYLVSDTAMELAGTVLAIIAPCLREEEQREAFAEIYEACKKALVRYETKADRANKRLGKP